MKPLCPYGYKNEFDIDFSVKFPYLKWAEENFGAIVGIHFSREVSDKTGRELNDLAEKVVSIPGIEMISRFQYDKRHLFLGGKFHSPHTWLTDKSQSKAVRFTGHDLTEISQMGNYVGSCIMDLDLDLSDMQFQLDKGVMSLYYVQRSPLSKNPQLEKEYHE